MVKDRDAQPVAKLEPCLRALLEAVQHTPFLSGVFACARKVYCVALTRCHECWPGQSGTAAAAGVATTVGAACGVVVLTVCKHMQEPSAMSSSQAFSVLQLVTEL